MDVELLSRIQFAVTIGFHFLFPPITIGLAWLLVVIEGLGWRRNDPTYRQAGRFFGTLLGLTFAVGVATGIVMEFQFGTNWSRYSKFVGDIFGAPLAAEAIFAFFLESTFLGVYLFARKRISPGWHWFSILMVAVGSTISAFWILVANSWMQTPAGYQFNSVLHRAELTDFWAAVFNPSTILRFLHTMSAAMLCGAFFLAGTAAYVILRAARTGAGRDEPARKAAKLAILAGLVFAIFMVFPTGDFHARQVADLQPEKFAAIEGLYETPKGGTGLTLFGIPTGDPPRIAHRVEIPNLLSWLVHGKADIPVRGLDQFPTTDVPPLKLTFVSFHLMAGLGFFFILLTALAAWRLRGGRIWGQRWLLWLLVVAIPLPLAVCQLGWIVAEVGRQPWIVYKLMRTADAFSSNLSIGHVLFSLILFSIIYVILLSLYLLLLVRSLRGPFAEEESSTGSPLTAPATGKEQP